MVSSLQSLIYEPGEKPKLQVLDQLALPNETKYIDVPNIQTAWKVIRDMNIRGAPLIAIVACLGLAVDLANDTSSKELDQITELNGENHGDAVMAYIVGKMEFLNTSRPTAVNLYNAMQELQQELKRARENLQEHRTPREQLVQAVMNHAEHMLQRDREDCKNIGKHGADAILQNKSGKVTIMTICNTGSLATVGYGTALGVVRAVQERGQLEKIVALETRPYNQGSRLTAYEIVQDKLNNGTLICDSMAAAMMRTSKVDAVVVGADRVCANGDTANKIGTYSLALIAAAHQVPVFVAAPFTTLDIEHATGDDIIIEERPAEELLLTSNAPREIAVWNPAFDVTPARYISGIVTEKGVIWPKIDGTIDVVGFVTQHTSGKGLADSSLDSKLAVPFDYQQQSIASLPSYLARNAPVAMEVLETSNADDLEAVEMGDGNLNLVFIVTNKTKPSKRVIVKQALPYVRCVGESWPMTLDRSYYEYRALTAEKEACPALVPSLYHFSKPNGLIVMEYLAPPIMILRKGLIQGKIYPRMARDMGVFCAHTLFKTSGFALDTKELRERVAFWSTNREMCALTEQVIFTEPYMQAANNRWTSPQLDSEKKAIEDDVELKLAAAKYKVKFTTETQALIHGDLHTGSVMCDEEHTYVIDPEFAFYGPMAFDTGAFIANLFLAYVSQAGQSNGAEFAEWILSSVIGFWENFRREFCELWNDPKTHTGFKYGRQYLDSAVEEAQAIFLKSLLADTLGFAGMKMLRRIVGIAHVEDLESITDADVRAKCERHGLALARAFIKHSHKVGSIAEAVQLARETMPKR